MARRRYGYVDYRYDDLTGGINVRDYPSEIEDKQCTFLKNWNFSGNKLVNEKGIENTGLPVVLEVGGLKEDNGDIWTVSKGNIYKNGILLPYGAGVLLKFNNQVFAEGVIYSITLGGTQYEFSGTTLQGLLDNMRIILMADGYSVIMQSDMVLVYKDDGSSISFGQVGHTYLAYNKISNFLSRLSGFPIPYSFKLEGTHIKGLYTPLSTETTEKVRENGYMTQVFNSVSSGYSPVKMPLSSTLEPLGASAESHSYMGVVINKLNTAPYFEDYSTYTGFKYGYIDILAGACSMSGAYLALNGTTISGSSVQDCSQTILTINITNAINGISGFTATNYSSRYILFWYTGMADFTMSSASFFNPLKKSYNEEYPQIDGVGYVSFISSNGTPKLYNKEYTGNYIIPTELSVGTGLEGRANITVGNIGSLVVDKSNGGAFYIYEGINVKISPSSIGEPRVGTIYNGKIVLGGYSGNDNIIFSKTSTPTDPLNVLNFSDFDAGGQSISGGDKGEVTGMITSENGLYVFKNNSIWYTNSEKSDSNSNSFNFIFRKITSNGAFSQNVITEVGQEVIYLDWDNRAVRRLGYEQNLTSLRDSQISAEIEQLLRELPQEQLLATAHYKYPNYQLSLTDGTSATVSYDNGEIIHMNNKHFIYNVYNKSWTIRDGIDDLLVSDKGIIVKSDGLTYKDFVGNTLSEGTFISKEYTFLDDTDFKRYGEIEVMGDIKGIGGDKILKIGVIVDEEQLDIGDDEEPQYRVITAGDGELIRFRERIELFDDGQRFKFKLVHSGHGMVEISDVNIKVKGVDVFHSDYY